MPDPRYLSAEQVAIRLGKSRAWFEANRDNLVSKGFPPRDEFFKAWDGNAIEAWIDVRSGIGSGSSGKHEGWTL